MLSHISTLNWGGSVGIQNDLFNAVDKNIDFSLVKIIMVFKYIAEWAQLSVITIFCFTLALLG